MAANKVILEFMGQNSEALKAARELKQSIEAAGYSLDDLHKKGKQSSSGLGDDFSKLFKDIGGGAAILSTTWRAVLDDLGKVDGQIAALLQKQQSAAAVSKAYVETLRQTLQNLPTGSGQDFARIDQAIRSAAGASSIGEGGLNKVTTLYGNILNAGPKLSEEQRSAALMEGVSFLQYSPTEDPAGIGIGIASVIEAGGGKFDARQALNSLRRQQEQSRVDNLANVGSANPQLAGAAFSGQTDLAYMQALWSFMTQRTGDATGNESASAIAAMVSKIMTRGATITDKLGGQFQVSGSFENRLRMLAQGVQAGNLDEAELGKLMPDLTRSETGKMFLNRLMNGDLDTFETQYLKPQRESFSYSGSYTREQAATLESQLPMEEVQAARRARESQVEAARAGDVVAAAEEELAAAFERKMKAKGLRPEYAANALSRYHLSRRAGMSYEAATSEAEGTANIEELPWPLSKLSSLDRMAASMQVRMGHDPRAGFPETTAAREERVVAELRALRGDMKAGATPRRPLKETGAR